MAAGLYSDMEIIERFVSGAVSTGNVTQPFVCPVDLDVTALALHAGTAPGASTITVNVSVSPTSQAATVGAYNLWTAANVPSIVNAAVNNFSVVAPTVIQNVPYAHNYPLPGPTGTKGYNTAQATSQSTETPVVAPPTIIEYAISGLLVPDNTYTDLNGLTQLASWVHAGDILTFVVGGTAGSTANLGISLYASKH